MVVISVYTYGVKIIKNFRWESGFLWGGSIGTPRYALTEVRGYLMQLSVNMQKYGHMSWIPQIRWDCYMIHFKLG